MKGIKPWHIAVFLVAVLLVGWRVFAYVQHKKQMSSGKYDPGPYLQQVNPRMPQKLQRLKERREREK